MQATNALIWNDEAKARFAALVSQELKRKKISQEDLAKAIGVTQGTISLWKKGAFKTAPSQTALMSFANFMGITVDDVGVRIGIADRKTVDIAEIKSAIGQADLEEALALQDALIDRVKEITAAWRTEMQSIGEAIAQYMVATAATEAQIAAELKKRGFRNVESRLPEILAGDSAYIDELRAIALFLYGPEGKSDQVRAMFGIKKPALRPEQATLNGANS